MAALRAIDSCNAQNYRRKISLTRRVQQKLLRFYEYAPGFARALGGAFLRDPRAIRLRVNAGAAGVNALARWMAREPAQQMPRAFQIHSAVFLHAAFAGRNGVDDPIEWAGKFFQIFPPRDVGMDGCDALPMFAFNLLRLLSDSSHHLCRYGRFRLRTTQFRGRPQRSSHTEHLVPAPDQFRPQRQPHITATDNQHAHSVEVLNEGRQAANIPSISSRSGARNSGPLPLPFQRTDLLEVIPQDVSD